MLRNLMFLIIAALIFSAGTKANAQKRVRIEITNVITKELDKVASKDSKGNRIALEITWKYIEQENLLKINDKIMVIAVFVDSKGVERKATSVIAVSHEALPTSTIVVINHEEQIVSPRDIKFVVTVAPQIKNASNTVAAKKEITLRVNPTK